MNSREDRQPDGQRVPLPERPRLPNAVGAVQIVFMMAVTPVDGRPQRADERRPTAARRFGS